MTRKDSTGVNVVQRSRRRLANLVAQPQQPGGWFRVLRNDGGTGPTRIDIYDEIGGGGWFNEGVSAIDFVAQLAAIQGDLVVHINSPGGDVFDGLAIYNSLAQRPGNVTTVVDGLAASAASFIAMAGKTRMVCPGAMFMIHEAAGLCMGNAADMRELADLLDKVSDNLAGIYAERSGRADGWRDAMKKETWYTADEAVAAGLAHRVAERPEQAALAAAARFDLSAYLHPPRIRDATESAGHGSFTGTHTHAHNSHDGPDADGDGFHAHEHTHAGEDHHHHDHDGASAGAFQGHAHPHVHAAAHEPAPYRREDGEDVCCPVCAKYNDTDARYCDQCGAKLVGREDVATDSGGPAAAARQALVNAGFTPDDARKIVNADGVDESDWDGPHAMSLAAKSDDPAATYKQICAGRREGDASQQDSWALPYKYPGKGPNRAGVKNALARLPQTQGLTNEAEAKSLLQKLMKQINPDYEPDDQTGLPAWLTAHHDTADVVPTWLMTPEEATQ